MELIKFGEVNYMNKKTILELKKVIFTESEIIVKNKKEDVTILYSNIKYTSYHKKNFINLWIRCCSGMAFNKIQRKNFK